MITVTYRIYQNHKLVNIAPPVVKEFKDAQERADWEKSQEHPYIQLVADIITETE
jgi:hypothetical protein